MNVQIDVEETGRGWKLFGTVQVDGQVVASSRWDAVPRLQWNRLDGRWILWVGEAVGQGRTVMVAARRLARELGADGGSITVRRHYGTGTREWCERIERASCARR